MPFRSGGEVLNLYQKIVNADGVTIAHVLAGVDQLKIAEFIINASLENSHGKNTSR